MIAPRSNLLRLGGRRVHYLEWGSPGAPPIVLVHGGSAHAHWWSFFAPHLADRYRLIAPDLRGHGDSDHVEPPDYSLAAHAADLHALLDALALARVRMVGHSLGGTVAAAFADRAPARLDALVLVDSRARVSADALRFMTSLGKLPHPLYASRDEAIARFRLLPKQTTAPAEVLAHVAACAVRPLDDGTWTLKFDRRTLGRSGAHDLEGTLARLPCPVLIVRGAASDILSAPALASLAARVPSARTAEISGAHHHVMLDRPVALAEVIGQFLPSHSVP